MQDLRESGTSIADANAPRTDVSVPVFNLLPLGVAFAIDRLITRLIIIIRAAVIAAIRLRADDRAGGETADDAGRNRAAITRKSRLRRDCDRQCQGGNGAQ